MKHSMLDASDAGTKVAAAQYNEQVQVLREAIMADHEAKSITSTLKSCRPMLTHYFAGDKRITKAFAAAQLQPKATSSFSKSWKVRDSRKPKPYNKP
jgi:hypothetical protein